MYTKRAAAFTVFGLVLIIEVSSRQQVQPPSVFRSVPTTVRARENATAVLPCHVESLGSATVKWWVGEALLAERTALDNSPRRSQLLPRATLRTDNSLEVTDLVGADTGDYVCQVVRPPPWPPIKQTHSIQVLFPATVALVPEDEVLMLQIGDVFDVLCDVTGVPAPVTTWTLTGDELLSLPEDELKAVRRHARLQFTITTRHAAGEYRCEASNDVGPSVSASMRLVVQHSPEVVAEKSWVHTSPDLRAELTCIVIAEPYARVTWYREILGGDYEEVLQTSRVSRLVAGERHSLMIRNVREADLGNYTCRASNEFGQAEDVLQLSGSANSAVIKSDVNMAKEDSYTLIWEVDSYSPVFQYVLKFRKYGGVEWRNLTIPASGGDHSTTLHSHSFTLRGLEPSTQYQAQIGARNRFGWSEPSSVFTFATLGPGDTPAEISSDDDDLEVVSVKVPIVSSKPSESNMETRRSSSEGFRASAGILPLIFVLYLLNF